jgi:hypothetical protein
MATVETLGREVGVRGAEPATPLSIASARGRPHREEDFDLREGT